MQKLWTLNWFRTNSMNRLICTMEKNLWNIIYKYQIEQLTKHANKNLREETSLKGQQSFE
jgi:hypothetical protein